jgi:hypothetical protein
MSSLILTLHLKHDNDEYVVQLPCLPDVPFSIAGDENENVGILVRAVFEQPEKSIGTWIACESEHISCRQWVACLDMAVKSQGVQKISHIRGVYHAFY